MSELPSSWVRVPLADVVSINPGVNKSEIDEAATINFVPMPAVEAESGRIDVSEERTFSRVRTGYTPFVAGDVLFAKITPCMENGKMAVVPHLQHGVGFGSTEFHVFRCPEGVEPKYIYYHTSSAAFRHDAEHNMTGAVGQKRVPQPYLSGCLMPLPSTTEQRRIVAKIEELFSELDKGVESLKLARAQLKLYRQSVLKHAFEGKLTADWREANPDKLEDPETLLARIQEERDTRYRQQLDDWNDAVADWRAGGEDGRKPRKPKRPYDVEWPHSDDEGQLKGWTRIPLGFVIDEPNYGTAKKCTYETRGFGVLRIPNLAAGVISIDDMKYAEFNLEEREAYRLEAGDLLTIRSNGSVALVGTVALVERSHEDFLYAGYLVRLRLNLSVVDPRFVLHVLRSHDLRAQIEGKAKSTSGVNNINAGEIKGLVVPICGLVEQREIVARLDEALSKIDATEIEIDAQLARSEALRQSILKQAFSGQLVSQDPSDEPASVLLERIKATPAAIKQKPRRGRKAA